jgi:hypothetical protein
MDFDQCVGTSKFDAQDVLFYCELCGKTHDSKEEVLEAIEDERVKSRGKWDPMDNLCPNAAAMLESDSEEEEVKKDDNSNDMAIKMQVFVADKA